MAHILIRIIWLTLIGWWLGPLWFLGSLLIMCTIILFPLGAYTMSKTWTVMTLKRSPGRIVNDIQQETNVTVQSGESDDR